MAAAMTSNNAGTIGSRRRVAGAVAATFWVAGFGDLALRFFFLLNLIPLQVSSLAYRLASATTLLDTDDKCDRWLPQCARGAG
jgi:hypothetical protein